MSNAVLHAASQECRAEQVGVVNDIYCYGSRVLLCLHCWFFTLVGCKEGCITEAFSKGISYFVLFCVYVSKLAE